MSSNLSNNSDYIISNVILEQKGLFSLNDILEKVKGALLSLFEDNISRLIDFINGKIAELCDTRLVSSTGFYYYVND